MSNSIFQEISTIRSDVQAQIDAITGGGTGPIDASVVTYSPTISADWVIVPTNAKEGLDELAANKLDATASNLNPAPSGAGKIPYDTGSAYAETATGLSTHLLHGGTTPNFALVNLSTEVTGALALSQVGNGDTTATELSYVHGVTSSIQSQLNGKQSTLTLPLSETNGGLGQDVSTIGIGLISRTLANTYLARTLTPPAAGLTITHPAGVAGNPTFAFANDLSALEGLSSTGIAVRSATDTWVQRTISAGSGIGVTNGDGVSGNPTIAIDNTVATLTGSQILTNKTISGLSNTLSNISNASLTNSSITISAGTGLTGGGSVALGGTSTSLAVSYGTTAGTAAQGNDSRFASIPSLPISESNGGFGVDVSGLGAGLLTKTATNTYTNRSIVAGTGIGVTNGSGSAGNPTIAIDSTVATLTGSQTLTNKTISGTSNTLSNIGNASLTNSSITIGVGTGLSGGGVVSLGGTSTALAVTYGTTAGTAAQGNDSRFSSIPSVPISEANGGLGSDTSALTAGLLTKTAANTYLNRSIAAGTGISVSNGAGTAGNPTVSIDSTVATLTGSQTLTNKTISGASNTLSNIGNASLTNSSVTVLIGTGLSGGGSVSLGGSTSAIAVAYGSSLGTATQGNDSRLNPSPSVAGKIPYDTGTGYLAITNGTTSQVLIGGATPAFGNVPSAALTSVPSASLTGSVAKANGGFAQDVSTGLTNDFVAIVSGGAITIGALTTAAVPNLAASKITSGTFAIAQIPTGSSSSTVTIGNDSRLPPTPSTSGKIVYDNGTSYSSTSTGGTTTTVLHGGTTPSYGAVSLTTDVTGILPIGNLPTGTSSSSVTIGNDTRLPPTPTAAGKLLYDTGSAYAESAAGTSGQILVSGGTGSPTWGTRGGAVVSFPLNTSQSFVANGYVGIAGDGSSTVNVNVTPWRVPANGTLYNMTVYSFTNAPSTLHCLIYKATTASTSPTYSATTLDTTVSSGSNIGEDTTHTVSVNKGDLIVGFCNTSWVANGAVINVMYSPT